MKRRCPHLAVVLLTWDDGRIDRYCRRHAEQDIPAILDDALARTGKPKSYLR